MRTLMADYFMGLDRSARTGERKVAWCTSVGPAELLRAMGFDVYFPENHGSMLGSTRLAAEYIPVANAVGYSPEICSYLTSDVGAFISGVTPLTRAYDIQTVPRPDVLVYNTNQCRDVQEWFAYYSREFGVPSMGIVSPRSVGELTEGQVESVQGQMEGLVPRLGEVSGEPLDETRLRDVVDLSLRGTRLWREVLEMAAKAPSPLTFFDGTIHMGPIVVLRGTQEAVDYYELLLEEMQKRVADGVAAVDGERFRLYWEGMPIWGRTRALSEKFASLGCCVVASTYCNSWIFDDFDPSDPFRSMAVAYSKIFISRTEEVKEQYLMEMVRRFGVHGVIFHDSKTCPNNSNTRYGMPQRLQEATGVPSLVLDGDLNDLRCFSDEQAMTNIEAFVEQLGE
jgi:benzoyl-CoA reductase/2-hydroxyglutaryl-CoA dehydratase subunit BcrC/BadD/HgdB